MDSARMWKDETTKLRMELPHLKVLYMSACEDETNSDSEV